MKTLSLMLRTAWLVVSLLVGAGGPCGALGQTPGEQDAAIAWERMARGPVGAVVTLPMGSYQPGVLLAVASGARTAGSSGQANPAAVREVEAGLREVADASWWGFDPVEATSALQAALRSKARRVIIPKMPSPWIVDKLELVGDKEILFEPGVELVAKRGAFRGRADSLLSAWDQANLKLIGPGARLRMWRADYDQPPYEKAEWRHVLSLRGCRDVLVEGLTLAESGGDGIYLGAGRQGDPNRNITIRNVVCLNNYRQGVSVITAENLLLENVVMQGTGGTPPAAGIDFEPNRPQERLVNCVLRNCVFENNEGFGVHIYLGAMDASSPPVSIRLENCVSRGTNAASLNIFNRNRADAAVRGIVEIVGCRFEEPERARVIIQNPVNGLNICFSRCRLVAASEGATAAAPIVFRSLTSDEEDLGQVRFEQFEIVDPAGRMPLRFENAAGVCLRDIQGEILVKKGEETLRYELTPQWLRQQFPCDPIRNLPVVPLERLRVVKAPPRFDGLQELPPHRLRGTTCYLIFARQGDTVRLEMAYQQVGRYEGRPLRLDILGPEAEQVTSVTLPFLQTTGFEFQAAKTGVYQIVGQPGANTLRLMRSSHPAAMGGQRGLIHLLGTTGQFYLHLPSGKQLGLSVAGEGPGERYSVALVEEDGPCLWREENGDAPRACLVEAETRDRVFQVHFLRPKEGVLEDVTLRLRGVGAILSFHPELWLAVE